MKIGIISVEHMHAYSYAEAISASSEHTLSAIFDERKEVRKQLSKKYPNVLVVDDYLKILSENICEAVIITSANAKHVKHAVAAAKSGKHILCEKPIATNIKDSVKIINECRKNNVVLMIAFPVRFASSVRRVKEIIRSGQIGEIYAAKTTNHGSMPGGWFIDKKLSGGGAIIDHTVHVADILRYIFEDEFVSVYAEKATKLHQIKVEDCGLLLFETKKGVICSLDTSWSRHPSYKIWGDVTLEIKGSKGNISVDCFPTLINLYQNKTMKHSSLSGGDNYDSAMINEFTKAIEEKREPFVTGNDGLKALELALGAYKAIKLKKKINLPL